MYGLLTFESAKPTKWSNTLRQFEQPTNCLSVFDHFVGLALKALYNQKCYMNNRKGKYW